MVLRMRGLRAVSRTPWLQALAATVAVCGVLLSMSVSPASAATRERSSEAAVHVGTIAAQAPSSENAHITELERQVQDLRNVVQLLLLPLGILVAILALGGALGVVFSIKDQKRSGQLHELAVMSEASGQRRTDESYTLFLDASQRTLTLVNDTLELAREATERAAHTMETKAASSLGSIEQEAQKLMLPLLEAGEFEAVVERREHREQLQTIAGDLRALEGYLLLQDIDLHPYSRFVKGIDHHLNDQTTEALQTLLRATQDRSIRELQRFSHYWVGYLRNTIGQHELARDAFEMAKEHLTDDAVQTFELNRIIAESRFFELAASKKVDGAEVAGARKRYAAIEHLLIDLQTVAQRLYSHDHVKSTVTSHEVASTRAALLTWIAYEADNPVSRFRPDVVKKVQERVPDETPDISGMVMLGDKEQLSPWNEFDDPELRAWALQQARSLYEWQEEVGDDFAIAFGLAECGFALGERNLIEDYRKVERMALDRLPWHREPRETAELAHAVFICRGRLHELRRVSDDPERGKADADLTGAYADVQRALGAIGDREITIYSHLQKRPLGHEEFQDELENFEEKVLAASG